MRNINVIATEKTCKFYLNERHELFIGHTRKDMIRNEHIREEARVTPIEKKMIELCLRWFGHIRRKSTDASQESNS